MSKHDSGVLAVNGGPKVRATPMPPRRLFGSEEKRAAMRVFDKAIETGNAFSYNGPEQKAYEAEFAAFHGGGYAVAVNSGTNAIFCALGGLQIDVAREVVVPPVTDNGGIMPAPMLNLVPVPADCAPGFFNTGPEQIEKVLSKRTAAIIVAHIAGEPADMDPIMELARARRIPVIEDCAQAHGARYKGRLVGAIGDVAAFSTMCGKLHATGAQGGMVYTRDEELIWRVKRFSDRGKPFNLKNATENVVMGLNCNQNDLAAAIGRAQLKKLPQVIAKRRRLAGKIIEGLKGLEAVSLGRELPDTEGVYWFLRVHVDTSKLTVNKARFASAVAAEGLPVEERYTQASPKRPWFLERQTYGRSGCPWTCPLYRGPRQPLLELPDADEVLDSHFVIYFHENYGAREVRDIVAALAKVERAFLKRPHPKCAR
ncbi:MAG: DegT/DnrJ/EryC1/StrS family aminotransferase [Verrucomicrobiota bacterium]|nr:DegT/DnrJ/EryC1/StrS family aminotransferase [Verrucomicrobiota bacterium]